MPTEKPTEEQVFLQQVERLLGRRLDPRETDLATSLQNDKTPALIARELEGAVVADPKKIRPEHSDTSNE